MMAKMNQFVVVDDDPGSNLISKFLILKANPTANITLFDDPEEALSVIKEKYNNPGADKEIVLLLDINMPFLSGWEFLEAFQDFSPAIQKKFIIYIVSSSIDDQDKEKAHNHLLVSGFLTKPLKLDDVEDIMSNRT